MNKTEFWILNAVGGLAALVLLTNVTFAFFNGQIARDAQMAELQVRKAIQVENITRELLQVTASGATQDPAIKSLLEQKYGITFREKQN